MHVSRPTLLVLAAAVATLAIGTAPTPLWDEDEPRFAAIARAMVETGDWIVPRYNDTLAVDKPVLMHWSMAAAMRVFGSNEFAARLPSIIATLITALALVRAGRRWFDEATGTVAALAFVGCLLVGVEAHAATPDAILVALTTWVTLLVAEVLVPAADRLADPRTARMSVRRALLVGSLTGLAVVCKGPVGFVGPLAVAGLWAWGVATLRRSSATDSPTIGGLLAAGVGGLGDVLRCLRPLTITLAMLAVAAPWYVAVGVATDGAWPAGFFLIHNVGRFVRPMEKHSGSLFFHPLVMLVGFYPWSCFLPLSLAVAGWRLWRRSEPSPRAAVLGLLLAWIVIWVGTFSAAATKLPNYVLPAYPAAALLVAALAVEAARRAAADPATGWSHPRWLAAGVASLAAGGVATAATVIVAARYGVPGAEPAALVGLVPIVGAGLCAAWCRAAPQRAVTALVVTGLAYSGLLVGPASWQLATANGLPAFVREQQAGALPKRLGTYMVPNPNVVFYGQGHVAIFPDTHPADAAAFLRDDADAVLLVPERKLSAVAAALPAGHRVVGRIRPLFDRHDLLAITAAPERQADTSTPTVSPTR